MTKKTLKLIGDLNNLYDTLFNYWITTTSGTSEFEEVSKKMKLLKVITKNIEEKSRGFLKSSVDYIAGGEYFLKNSSSSYSLLHNEITKIMLKTDFISIG
ncbi:MAG: hypothetical protein PHI37_00530 [Candidatus Gracilibacteria bacterium]|nr:hypothetical protein [Candidatus Gracilibacteria bacterium]